MTSCQARELLAACVGRRVLLVGDLMLDEWAFGTVGRISPEAPIPVVTMPLAPEARSEKPGGAGNVAAILLGLGAAVRVVGVVGDDGLGYRLKSMLAHSGAEVSFVLTDPSRPTTHKLRIIAGRQQLLRIDTELAEPISTALAAGIRDAVRAGLGEADVVLVADYAKGVLSSESLPQELIAQARSAGIPFCADPKPANIGLFRGATLVSPNESEALAAAGPTGDVSKPQGFLEDVASLPPPLVYAGLKLRDQLDADLVFVTRGDRGLAIFARDGQVRALPSRSVAGGVGDGTGCGDAATAASALALSAGADWLAAAALANAAGGVVSRFVGVHNPTADEIAQWLEQSG
jgi:D-beta-D-heptose 7-phosphate kinase/D-beta-D-heptose 1-phosphate adenosyltransferase